MPENPIIASLKRFKNAANKTCPLTHVLSGSSSLKYHFLSLLNLVIKKIYVGPDKLHKTIFSVNNYTFLNE